MDRLLKPDHASVHAAKRAPDSRDVPSLEPPRSGCLNILTLKGSNQRRFGRSPGLDLADTKGNAANQDAAVISTSVRDIKRGGVNMQDGFLSRITDRVVANARAIRRAPEAIVLIVVLAVALSSLGFLQIYRERVSALNDRIASQEWLLSDYRTKLHGASPDDAATQIEKLTSLLADAQKSLRAAKSKPVSVDNRSRDPLRLYEDSRPIALVHDPKIDLDKRKITFPAVNAEVILNVNKSYEFQDWKLACGSTQLYSMVGDGSGREYSYSPLTCKIVGSR